MKRTHATCAICAVVVLGSAQLKLSPTAINAQTPSIPPGAAQPGPRPQMPPRDGTAAVEAKGNARIRGRVIAADTGAPLRRAQVRITASEIRVMRATQTDAEGRYELADLPAGRYTVMVTRNGYVTLQFGQQRPFEPGRPLVIADAQVMDRIDFALPRGSVIAGRVTDELGEPIAAVRMSAMRYRYTPTGERQLISAGPMGMFNIVTNDLGEYRLFGLMPGTYVVSANPDDGGFVSMPGGGIMPPGTIASPADSDGYATTYYPGTVSAEQAQPITVGVAETATANFPLSVARMSRISGIVQSSQNAPLTGARVMLRSLDMAGGFFRGVPVGPDGRFMIMSVPPGDYLLDVGSMMMGATKPGETPESASVAVSAAGRDITDLVITTAPGATVSGRVVYEGAANTTSKPDRVFLQSADPRGMAMRGGPDQGLVDASGRFQLRGVSGRIFFRPSTSTPTAGPLWTLKAVTLNGQDITDVPLDITSAGDVDGIEIVLTDKFTTVSGTVTNSQRVPIKDYAVAIFPERLREEAQGQRFTRVARPDQEGRYQIRGLPPGDYVAVAVPALESGDEWDPAFRKQVEPSGKRFRLTEGQSVSVDLQLAQ